MILSKRSDYDFAVDMWSLGCIVAELYNGLPLFLATSQYELIEYQHLYCGGFDRDDLIDNYDDWRSFINIDTPNGLPIPIPDPKPRYASVKPKTQSSIIKEVFCRKKLKDGQQPLKMELSEA